MSFDLAVWEGPRPRSDAEAAEHFDDLVAQAEDDTDPRPPTPAIAAFVEALAERHPELTAESGDESPWASGPLIGGASGSSLHLNVVWSRAAETAASVADLAADHGLVCFDPQDEVLLPRQVPRRTGWRRLLPR